LGLETVVGSAPLKQKKHSCRQFRTNSLKDGTMRHLDLLLSDDHEKSNYRKFSSQQENTAIIEEMFSMLFMLRCYKQDHSAVVRLLGGGEFKNLHCSPVSFRG
jgi:hypothetical protein